MSSPAKLPRALDPIAIGATFQQPLHLFESDRTTPLDLTGKVLTLFLNRIGLPEKAIEIVGDVNAPGVVVFDAPPSETADWPRGIYAVEVRMAVGGDDLSILVGGVTVAKGAGASGEDRMGAARTPWTPAVAVGGAAAMSLVLSPSGLKGDKGDKGDTGEQGASGPQGPQGPVGAKGDKGDSPTTAEIDALVEPRVAAATAALLTKLEDVENSYALEMFNLSFETGVYTVRGQALPLAQVLTATRSSVKNAANIAGVYSSFAADAPAVTDRGLLVESTRTNVVRWNRDLTNAVWTKTNATVAKDQTGIDGVANAASSMTATAAGATVTQAITVTAANRWFSVFLTRLAGAGALTVTLDGANYYPVVQIEGDRHFVQLPTGLYYESRANPVIGFKMADSGDKWRVDAVQFENSAIGPSSPIYTTTGQVSRAADTAVLTDLLRNLMSMRRGTLIFKVRNLMSTRAIGTYPQVINARIDAQNKVGIEVGTGSVDAANPPPGWTSADAGYLQAFVPYKDGKFVQKQYSQSLVGYATTYKGAVSWAPGLSRSVFSNGASAVLSELTGAFDDIAPVQVAIGNNNGGQHGNMYVAQIIYLSGPVSAARLAALAA